MKESVFAECPECLHQWSTQKEFVTDDNIHIAGYIANFTNLGKGTFLFTHNYSGELKLHVELFMDLYNGVVHDTLMYGTAECPGYCNEHHTLSHCSIKCKAAMVREIIQNLKYFKSNLK